MTLIRGLDASAWTKEIPPRAWESLAASGIKFFIPQIWGSGHGGTGPNPYLGQHVTGAVDAGIIVLGGYIWPSWKWPEALAHWGAQTALRMPVAWLDVEARAGVHPDQLEDIQAIGVIPGIYASRHSWSSIMGAESWAKAQPLWVAHYRGGPWPTTLNEGDVPYLPDSWGSPKVWQWLGTTTLHDDQYDLNVADEDWVRSLFPPPEEELTVSQYEELKADVRRLDGRIDNIPAGPPGPRGPAGLPGGPAPTPTPRPSMTYTVQPGDTLSGIASAHGVAASRWTEIPNIPANVRADPRKLQVGFVLQIPW